jgi:large subunit ribosomal protein L31
MKSGIHPNYFPKTTITCSCGTVFETGSTVENMRTEICSQCHPFYTGKKKFIDVAGRVDRFKKLAEKSEAKKFSKAKVAKTKTTGKSASASEATTDKKTAVKKEEKDTKPVV